MVMLRCITSTAKQLLFLRCDIRKKRITSNRQRCITTNDKNPVKSLIPGYGYSGPWPPVTRSNAAEIAHQAIRKQRGILARHARPRETREEVEQRLRLSGELQT